MSNPVLVIAWLVLAHLVADFVLQNDWIAINKGTPGRGGWAALSAHGGHVALCLIPVVPAFGLPGLAYLVVVALSHVAVDRWKVRATRRAEQGALEAARRRLAGTGEVPQSGLGAAWTPWPGLLFLADQVLHLTIAIVGWLVLLEGVALLPGFVDVVNAILKTWDRQAVNAVVLTGVVLVSLFIVNTRAAYYFVLALVSPREMPAPVMAEVVPPPVAGATGSDVETAPATEAPSPEAPARPHSSVPSGAPARIGATIGALERLLVVTLVLSGAVAAVGFVIAAKTLARFKQLDDRGFAEYYLLGTLASVSVALGSALLAAAALATLG